MAYQPINYSNIAPMGNEGMRDWLENFIGGYKNAQIPGQLRRQQENEELTNALKRMDMEQKPQMFQADLLGKNLNNQYAQMQVNHQPELFRSNMDTALLSRRLSQARIDDLERKGQLPFGGEIAPGDVGQDMWVDKIGKTYGYDSPQYLTAKTNRDISINSTKSRQESNQAYANSLSFRNLPSTEKNRIVATGVGMGYDPVTVSQRIGSGETLEDLAQEKGVKLSDVDPVYPLSTETQKQLANRQAFNNEIKNLEKSIAEPLSKAGRRFNGYSPTQIWGAIKNDNPDEQGQILAAYAIQPELAGLRLKSMSAQVGIQALEAMQEASFAKAKTLESTISPQAREKMNHYLSKWIGESSDVFNKTIKEGARLGGRSNKTKSVSNKSDPLGIR